MKLYQNFPAGLCRLITLLTSVSLFTACSDNSTINRIPGDANWVAYADLRKLAIQTFSLKDLLSGKVGGTSESVSKEDEEIKWEESGIDILSKVVIFEKHLDESGKILMILIPLSDQDDFRSFMERNWNISPSDDMGSDWISGNGISFSLEKNLAIGIYSPEKLSAEIIRSQVDLIRNLKEEDNLLQKSERFSDLMKEERSVAIWADLGKMVEESASLLPEDLLSGELCGSLDFQTGKMVADAKIRQIEPGKSSGIFGKALGAEMINKCASGNSAETFLALSVSFKNLFALVDQNPLAQGSETLIASSGLSREDLEKELSGEIALHYVSQAGQYGLRMLIGCNNDPAYLLQKLSAAGQVIPDNYGHYKIPGPGAYEVRVSEKTIEIAPDWFIPGTATKNEGGKFALENPSFIAGLISLSALQNNNMLKEDEGLREISKIWKSLRFRVGNTEPKVLGMSMTMECSDNDHSSLLALFETIRLISSDPGKGKQNLPLPIF